MSKVIINNQQYEGEPGERLIDVARRNGEHIGFLCDGLGVCQTCVCRVESGAEHLNEITEIEQNWLNEQLQEEGYRFGCKTTLRGPGPIEVMSRAEEIRRQIKETYFPPEGTNAAENLNRLLNTVGKNVMNQIGRFPFNAAGSVPIIMKSNPKPPNALKIFNDFGKVLQTMLGGQSGSSDSTAIEKAKK